MRMQRVRSLQSEEGDVSITFCCLLVSTFLDRLWRGIDFLRYCDGNQRFSRARGLVVHDTLNLRPPAAAGFTSVFHRCDHRPVPFFGVVEGDQRSIRCAPVPFCYCLCLAF